MEETKNEHIWNPASPAQIGAWPVYLRNGRRTAPRQKTQEDYERDVKMPSIERAMEIASYFGCPLGWLLGDGDTFAYEITTEGFMRDVNNGFNALTAEIAALRTDLARKEG